MVSLIKDYCGPFTTLNSIKFHSSLWIINYSNGHSDVQWNGIKINEKNIKLL